MSVPLPDCYTGIMCYSAGHDGFSSFDNTLFLRGSCNPGASCGDKENGEEQILGKTCYRWTDVLLFYILLHVGLSENTSLSVTLCL